MNYITKFLFLSSFILFFHFILQSCTLPINKKSQNKLVSLNHCLDSLTTFKPYDFFKNNLQYDTLYTDENFRDIQMDYADILGFKTDLGDYTGYFYVDTECSLIGSYSLLNNSEGRTIYHGAKYLVNKKEKSKYKGNYQNGYLVGQHEIVGIEKNNLIYSANIDSSTYKGTATYFYSTGKIKSSGILYKNYKAGFWNFYKRSGKLDYDRFYENDLTIEEGLFNVDSILNVEFGISIVDSNKFFELYTIPKYKKFSKILIKQLTKKYHIMAEHLNHNLNHKVKVEMFHNGKYFKRMSGMDAKNIAAVALGRYKIKMISPLNNKTSPKHFREMVVHEFNHILVHDLIKGHYGIPRWVSEGLAEYESGGKPYSDYYVRRRVKKNKIPKLAEIDQLFYHKDHKKLNRAYRWSHTLIKHIIELHGWDLFNQYLRTPWNIEEIYGTNENGLWIKWVESFKKKT